METDRHIRRNFHDVGFCAYEIEKVQRPFGEDEYEDRMVLRLTNGREFVSFGFRLEEKQSLVQFAKDILQMTAKWPEWKYEE